MNDMIDSFVILKTDISGKKKIVLNNLIIIFFNEINQSL